MMATFENDDRSEMGLGRLATGESAGKVAITLRRDEPTGWPAVQRTTVTSQTPCIDGLKD